jgi:uncharacterized Ntn-hydrolase superfamily protein
LAEKQALETRLQQGQSAMMAAHASQDAALADRVREALAASGGVADEAQESSVLALVLDAVGQERATAEEAKSALRDREVENLQRRIEKLTQSLSTTEHRLRQVAAMKNIDDGISSIYREVQGLD